MEYSKSPQPKDDLRSAIEVLGSLAEGIRAGEWGTTNPAAIEATDCAIEWLRGDPQHRSRCRWLIDFREELQEGTVPYAGTVTNESEADYLLLNSIVETLETMAGQVEKLRAGRKKDEEKGPGFTMEL
jgi:hypothetical protein